MRRKKKETDLIERNIASIYRVRKASNDALKLGERIIDHIACLAGSLGWLYVHALFYGTWAGIAVYQKFSMNRNYPLSASEIGLVASLEAIFLAILVLVNQRKMNVVERKSSDLHLQMSLLAEHEITRLARVTDLIAKKLAINTGQVDQFEQVKKDFHPDEVLEKDQRLKKTDKN